ncbi:hypothetical protein HH303_15860 [Rhodospirillaceae bacterium KN72]|uniref:Uncharacterized protein n=1 Tax=Pacificispira spongiicola TaxID=2729598 RepID=A0A7Y0E2D6_9PROT|nr:hypothetical protein [Pacificispira spongiicola]NMM45973.1 hypothetical protein [Pacificispira spongiicola]
MALEAKDRRYLVVIQLDRSSDLHRVGQVVPAILGILTNAALSAPEQAFRSSDGQLFGFLLKSRLNSGQIRARFEGDTATNREDGIFIMEAGEDFNGIHFTRAWTWLQHH